MTAPALLRALVLLGRKPVPCVSDLEAAVGPLHVDVDSFDESTALVVRPCEAAPFWFVTASSPEGAGGDPAPARAGERSARVCHHAPVTFGSSPFARIKLSPSGHTTYGEIRLCEGGLELALEDDVGGEVSVGGRPVTASSPLQPGDEIRVGPHVLRVSRHPGWTPTEPFSPLTRAVRAHVEWDVHHDRPHVARDRPLRGFTLALSVALAEVLATLGAAFGPARPLAGDEIALHPFYVKGIPQGTVVEWCARVPERALGRLESGARERLLVDLLASLERAETLEEIARLVEARRAVAGVAQANVRWAGSTADRVPLYDFAMELRPAMDARELCVLAGLRDACARSTDVHMSRWRIEARVGRWIVELRLSGWPRRVDGRPPEAADRYELGTYTGDVEWIHVRAPD